MSERSMRERCIEAAREAYLEEFRRPWDTDLDWGEIVDAVLAELREPDAVMLLAMSEQRGDMERWRAAIDAAIRPGAERDAPSERRGGPSSDEAVGEKGERPEDAIGR